MRLRSKLLLMALAALAGFLASQPDIRKRLTQNIEDYKLSIDEALEEAKQAAANKEEELTQEVKSTQEETKEVQ